MKFLDLPEEVLELVCSKLKARDLCMLGSCSKAFSSRSSTESLAVKDGTNAALGLVERVAKTKLLQLAGCQSAAERWPASSWKERLAIEESAAPLDRREIVLSSTRATLRLAADQSRVRSVVVPLLGPELVTSVAGTAQQPFVRWHIRLENHSSFEVGAVPVTRRKLRFGLHMPIMFDEHFVSEEPSTAERATAPAALQTPKRNQRTRANEPRASKPRPPPSSVLRSITAARSGAELDETLALLQAMVLCEPLRGRALPTPHTSSLQQPPTSPVAGPGPTAAAVGWRTYPIAQPSHAPWLEALAVPPSPSTTLELLLRRHTSRIEVLVHRDDVCRAANANTHRHAHETRGGAHPDCAATPSGSSSSSRSSRTRVGDSSALAQASGSANGSTRDDLDVAEAGLSASPGGDELGFAYLHRALPYLPGSDMHLAITLWRKGTAVFLPEVA